MDWSNKLRDLLEPRLLCAILLLAVICSCKDSGAEPTANDLIGVTGTVLAKSADFYVIECDAPIYYNTRTCYPTNLPSTFKQDHLRVRFSGKMMIDPLIDYGYLPVRLSFIVSIQ